jgi:exosortase/archaeosortase
MKIEKWITSEIPFMVLLAFLLMGIIVEVNYNRLDLLTANLPLISLMIIYLVFRRWDI